MVKNLLSLYRSFPWFKGKLPLGKVLFASCIESPNPTSFTAHGGIMYHLPNTLENVGIELLINGIYEKEVVRFLKQNIPDNAIYFDIGANIGSLGLPVVKEKKGIAYFGFEASPFVFPYLQKNFESNGIRKYKLINKIVHKDNEQKMKFYHSDLYGKSSLAPTYSTKFVELDSLSIENYCEENSITSVDWMKIDVQGFELNVFEGMKTLLMEKKIRNILFEFEAWAEEAAGFEAGAAKNYLENLEYTLYDLAGNKWIQSKVAHDTMIWARPNP